MTDEGPKLDLEGVLPARLPDEPPPEDDQGKAAKPEESAPPEASEEEVPSQEAGESEEPEKSDDAEDTAAKPKPKGVQKRIDELTGNWRAEQRRAEHLQGQIDRLLRMQEDQLKPGDAQQDLAPPEERPRQEDFQNYDDYLVAVAKHEAMNETKSLVQKELDKLRQQQEATTQVSREQQAVEAFNERAAQARAKYDDFDTVVATSTAGVTETMTHAIRESDLGPDIVYHLGKNPDVATRIASLSPISQVRELGKLEVQLSQAPKRTNASAPPAQVKPSGSVEKTPENMTHEEYRKWRGLGPAP